MLSQTDMLVRKVVEAAREAMEEVEPYFRTQLSSVHRTIVAQWGRLLLIYRPSGNQPIKQAA